MQMCVYSLDVFKIYIYIYIYIYIPVGSLYETYLTTPSNMTPF